MSIELVMPSNHLIFCCPLLLPSVFPSIKVFASESAIHIRWPKYWSFSFSINEYSGLIFFRIDWFDVLGLQGTLESLLHRLTMNLSSVNSVQSLSRVLLFATPWTAAHQASLSITKSQSLLKLMSLESVMPSNHLILCCPLFLPQSFQASGTSPMTQFFASGGQRIGVSASASMNIQDRFPSGWTGLISLQSKGLSKVFSNTTVQKYQFFGAQFSYNSPVS